ncbi:pentapeptide repeat-containing protein [Salinispora arenicola]|uniref:pentapeptide repeat-containing protein n=1 Tax=Salinispora arenicola TaxID=168697 RepID=UPI0027DD2728|nr:pentapeptide repeat-containing protein [Salinispora arenicola]
MLDVLTADRALPAGCDRWGIHTVHPDLRSRDGYRWPWPGQWAEAPGPIDTDNTSECPVEVGDGICLARTWRAMASGGVPAVTLLLCAWSSADLLSDACGDTWRLRRAYVVDIVDGARLVREHGRGANLRGANLRGANLEGANLRGADL